MSWILDNYDQCQFTIPKISCNIRAHPPVYVVAKAPTGFDSELINVLKTLVKITDETADKGSTLSATIIFFTQSCVSQRSLGIQSAHHGHLGIPFVEILLVDAHCVDPEDEF